MMKQSWSGFDVVDIWVGVFSPPELLMEYVEDQQAHWDDETDTVPVSKLAADMNEWFIDHDFVCAVIAEEPQERIVGLLEDSMMHAHYGTIDGALVGDAYIADLYAQQNGAATNAIVLVYDEEIKQPKSVRGDGYWLHYIGRFYDQQKQDKNLETP
jgi:hypothetical protein